MPKAFCMGIPTFAAKKRGELFLAEGFFDGYHYFSTKELANIFVKTLFSCTTSCICTACVRVYCMCVCLLHVCMCTTCVYMYCMCVCVPYVCICTACVCTFGRCVCEVKLKKYSSPASYHRGGQAKKN